MNKNKIVTILLSTGIGLGLLAIGVCVYILLTPQKETMKYDDAVALSKQIKENQIKNEKILKEINKNKELTKEEKIKQEIKEEKKSELYKEYEKLTEEQKEEIDAIPREEEVPIEKLDEIIEEQRTDKGIEIPSKFNLADKINIKVEDQGSRGLCWDFAATKSAETFLALHYGKDYDLSEQHVNYITSNLLYGERAIDTGGNFNQYQEYLAQSGVVLEKDVPYDKDYNEEEYSKFLNMEPVKIITNTVDFPSVYKASDNAITGEKLEEFRKAVKKHIMTNGSLYTVIVKDGYNKDTKNVADMRYYYISKANPNNRYADHAVSIVGWDDNFPKEKFNDGGNIPEHDGAYIVLNSWGNWYTDEDGNKTGYIYVSYDDIFIENELSGITSAEIDDENVVYLDGIKSPSIKKYLTQHYNYAIREINNRKYIPKFELTNITSIELDNAEIDLKELEMFSEIDNLTITNSKLTSIDELPNFEKLVRITLSNNSLENIDKLANYSTLRMIYVGNNNIKDVSNLSNLKLSYIDLSNNKGVRGYGALNVEFLDLSDNNLSQLENINPKTYTIYLNNNNFEQIPNELSNITSLTIINNKLTTLTGIENITNLRVLDISQNNIEDLTIPNSKLEKFAYNDTSIKDITQLNNIPAKIIELKNDNIKSLEGYNPTDLYSLDLSGNKGITGYGKMKTYTLIIDDCDIKELEETNESIKSLNANSNSLTSLNNLEKTNILLLSIDDNKETISGTINLSKINSLSIKNTTIDSKAEITSNERIAIFVSDYDTFIRLKNIDHDHIVFYRAKITEEQLKEIVRISEENKLYHNTNNNDLWVIGAILDIDADAVNNTIDISKYPILRVYYSIYTYFEDDNIIISRDRKTVTIPETVEKIKNTNSIPIRITTTIKNADSIPLKTTTTEVMGEININIKRNNSILNGLINIFKSNLKRS